MSIFDRVKTAYSKNSKQTDEILKKVEESGLMGAIMGSMGGMAIEGAAEKLGAKLIGKANKNFRFREEGPVVSKENLAKRGKMNKEAPINKERKAIEKSNIKNPNKYTIKKTAGEEGSATSIGGKDNIIAKSKREELVGKDKFNRFAKDAGEVAKKHGKDFKTTKMDGKTTVDMGTKPAKILKRITERRESRYKGYKN